MKKIIIVLILAQTMIETITKKKRTNPASTSTWHWGTNSSMKLQRRKPYRAGRERESENH